MRKKFIYLFFILFFSCPVYSLNISELILVDSLQKDLSMRENILLNITDNTDKEFVLNLPEGAYDLSFNKLDAVNGKKYFTNITQELINNESFCSFCIINISYSFNNIVFNNSGNYFFYRKIDFPANVGVLKYEIVLPSGHEFNTTIYPEFSTNFSYNKSNVFWYYTNPGFPLEFRIVYKESYDIGVIEKNKTKKINIDIFQISIVALITFFLLLFLVIISFFVKMKAKKKK
ncbi:MAG: hypothetical protein QXK76_00855 [Candidatus Woesearchaeota archaeon]